MKNSDTLAVFCLLLRVGLLALSFPPPFSISFSPCSICTQARMSFARFHRLLARLLAGISTRISRCDVILHRPATPRRRFNLPCVMTFLLPLSHEPPSPPLSLFCYFILVSLLFLLFSFSLPSSFFSTCPRENYLPTLKRCVDSHR